MGVPPRAGVEGGGTRYELSNLNALFGQKNLSLEEDFLNLLSADYGAGMHVLDFAAASGR